MKCIAALCAAFLCAHLLISCFPVHGEDQIYDSMIRPHVLANSDSEEDQALKLKVRDAVLEATAPLVKGCTTQAEAIEILNDLTPWA